MVKLVYPRFWQTRNIISCLLTPLSLVYFLLGLMRKAVSVPMKLPATVICIGNITVGGTGKTQVAISLAQILTAKKINFVIISKGYGAPELAEPLIVTNDHSAKEVGEESLELLQYGSVIVAKKITQATNLIKQLKAEVIIADDGMQNPNFHKDLTIMVVDRDRGMGNGLLIPAGPLRQTVASGLKIADIIVAVGITANNSLATLPQPFHQPIFYADIASASEKIDKTKPYLAFCAIGNHERFFALLKKNEVKILEREIYPDHYDYLDSDLSYLASKARSLNCSLITTRKDYIKVGHKLSVDCFNVKLRLDRQAEFSKLIYEKIHKSY